MQSLRMEQATSLEASLGGNMHPRHRCGSYQHTDGIKSKGACVNKRRDWTSNRALEHRAPLPMGIGGNQEAGRRKRPMLNSGKSKARKMG